MTVKAVLKGKPSISGTAVRVKHKRLYPVCLKKKIVLRKLGNLCYDCPMLIYVTREEAEFYVKNLGFLYGNFWCRGVLENE